MKKRIFRRVFGLLLLIVIIVLVVLFKIALNNKEPLQPAKESTIVDLENGMTYEMYAQKITQKIDNFTLERFAYNGQIPGPLIRLKQNSTIQITFFNNLAEPTTIHWHGLRHDIRDDGVPETSQKPIPPGGSYTYTLYVPDAGMFWYHPHVREDKQQDLGLAGNILVIPQNESYWHPVDKEISLMLDDILLEEGKIVPHGKDSANYAMMGRFGNTLLINGKPFQDISVKRGETIRFYLTNAANVRPFNVSFEGMVFLLVGSDLGKYEIPELVQSVIIHPGERQVIEVAFVNESKIIHATPTRSYVLGNIKLISEKTNSSKQNATLDSMPVDFPSQKQIDQFLRDEPDYVLEIDTEMSMMHHGMTMSQAHIEPIEWEDPMPHMNSQMNTENTKWIFRDQKTGKTNMDIMMHAQVGDKIKIRIINPKAAMHPMQHPIHLHGQRFLALSTDGIPNNNFVWKDTLSVPAGSTVDILVDATNPGEWMFHCHIAEHLEAGMMSSLEVIP